MATDLDVYRGDAGALSMRVRELDRENGKLRLEIEQQASEIVKLCSRSLREQRKANYQRALCAVLGFGAFLIGEGIAWMSGAPLFASLIVFGIGTIVFGIAELVRSSQ